MIKIERSESPQRLVDNPNDVNRYNHKEVVSALWNMQNKKCCYCEMYIPETGHLKNVEHSRPRSIFPEQTNEWTNLLLACSQCNGSKSDKYPVILSDSDNDPAVIYMHEHTDEEPAIIDPSNEEINPEDHISFKVDDGEEDWGLPIHMSERGHFTIEVTGIYKDFYIKRRRMYYLNVLGRAYRTLLMDDVVGDQAALTESRRHFERLLSPHHKFTGFARSFARSKERNITELGVIVP